MTIQTQTIKIDGMSCQGCVNSVTKSLSTLSGIKEVDVSLEKNSATIRFDDNQTTIDNIIQNIENAGFDIPKL